MLERGDHAVARGFCAVTRWPEDEQKVSWQQSAACERDSMGSWSVTASRVREAKAGVPKNESLLQAECVRMCRACSRCRYISYSYTAGVCAWYANCDMDDLRNWWSHSLGVVPWSTMRVRSHVPLAVPAWRNEPNVRPLRLAIAALAFGSDFCPLAMWCQSARKLKWTLQDPWHVQLLILWAPSYKRGERRPDGSIQKLSPRPAEFCAEAEVVLADEELRTAGKRCLRKGYKSGYHTGMPIDIMLKWQFMAMKNYDAILFVDSDVDMFPLETEPEVLRARWQDMLPLFLRPRHQLRVDSAESRVAAMRLLVCTDGSSPVNTGLMLFKPSIWLYQDGLRVLKTCPVNKSHGWGYVGKPRSLRLHPRYFSATAGGSTTVRPAVNEAHFWFTAINKTGAMTNNWWKFVAAAEDQGFFWYMLFLRHDLGVYFNPDAHSAPGRIAHTVNHYFGRIAGAKAWEGKLWNEPAHLNGQASPRLGTNLHYLSRLEPTSSGEEYRCAEGMRALRKTAESHPLAQRPRTPYTGARPPRFAIW